MALDIYIHNPKYRTFDPRRFFVQNPLDKYLQQVDMIMRTQKGSVMGQEDFGVDLESYLFEYRISDRVIKAEITEQLEQYSSLYALYPTEILIQFEKGEFNDVMYIDFNIQGSRRLGYLVTAS